MEKLLFKKVELWLVLIVVIAGLFALQVSTWAVFHQLTGGQLLGRFGEGMVQFAKIPHHAKRLVLARNPYLAPENRFEGEAGWVFGYSPGARPEAPFVLVSRHDPDAGLGVSELVNLDSQTVVFREEWRLEEIWEDIGFHSGLGDVKRDRATRRFSPAHSLILPDGRVISKYRTPLLASDVCGRLSAFNSRYLFHHSMEADENGNVWTSAHIEPKTVALGSDKFLDDGIVKLSPDGEILFEKSVSRILLDNELDYLLYGFNDFVVNDDPIHLNDVQPVETTGRFWQKGDVFLSLRHLSMVLLYRPSSNEIVWYRLGLGTHQHDVNVISENEISIFDNNTINVNGQRGVDGANRMIIYDFETDTVREVFSEALTLNDVRTPTNGRGRLLDDGRLFYEETDFGRAAAVNQDGTTDWQFINRGEDGNVYSLRWTRIVDRETAARFLEARKNATCE